MTISMKYTKLSVLYIFYYFYAYVYINTFRKSFANKILSSSIEKYLEIYIY